MTILYVNETLFETVHVFNETSVDASFKYNVCLSSPPHIISDGIWGEHKTEWSPFRSSCAVFLHQVVLIYATTRAINFLIKKLGLPILISEMMAGLILGPMMPVFIDYKRKLFPFGSQDTLATITALAYVLFLFETGVKVNVDINSITRTGRKALTISIFGLLIPLLIALYTPQLNLRNRLGLNPIEEIVIMFSHNKTSFAVIYSLLNDLKILNSELGRLALSVALVGDILSNIVVTITSTIVNVDHHIPIGMRLGSLVAMAIFILLIYRPAMFWIVEHTPEGKEVKHIYVNIVIGILFCLCWLSGDLEFLPFIFGLATPEGTPLGSTLIKRVNLLGIKFFLPIYMTTSTMKVEYDFWNLSSTPTLNIFWFILVMGYIFKIVACFLSLTFFDIPLKDSICLVLIWNCKGVVQITMNSTALDKHDIHLKTYCLVVMIIMVSICGTHLLVRCLYDPSRKYAGYEKRNILSLKPNSELKILVCIHKQHQISPMAEFIDLCHPLVEDPISIDALHLIELAGRSSPVFISHKKKKVGALNLHDSYSDNVVRCLKRYEHDKQGATIVNPYTAISPLNSMHDELCHLALDKISSIIVLPFHKKWSCDGKLEYDDKNIRSLNKKVLDNAPCSVGILVTRAVHQPHSSLRLALAFIGGRDDREALSLVKRAARNSSIKLMVYHIVDKNKSEEDNNDYLDTVLDIAMLKDVNEEHSRTENVTFREIEVEGGSETLDVLRQMVNENDFIIVGRRHGINSPETTRLHDCSEFPELGPIGDYLASSDLDCKASILVLQQQQQICIHPWISWLY